MVGVVFLFTDFELEAQRSEATIKVTGQKGGGART
jgi:hypothetical protein